jgi:branched-chain amino acid transport system ATP-binding protein
MTDALLELEHVSSGYGDLTVVRDVSFDVESGSITVLLGRNGAGKTTLLKTVAGLLPIASGDVRISGASMRKEPAYRRTKHGLGFVQENKRVFKRRSVEENLRMGAYAHQLGRTEIASRLEAAYERFPVLETKRRDVAGHLSGGQQQMLAIAQALIGRPGLLLLDEPFSGLAPSIVRDVMESVRRIKTEDGCTVLMVEQSVDLALSIADRVLVMDVGEIVYVGRPDDTGVRDTIEDIYFGRGAASLATPTAEPSVG